MKYLSSILPLLLGCFLYGFGQQPATSLSPDEFAKGISQSNIQLLDVRTAQEFQAGHIAHALQANWNNQDEFRNRVQYVDKTKPLYVYCAAGGRSKAAAQWLRGNGYTNVYELAGGFIKWKAENKPVEGMPAVKPMSWNDYTAAVSKGITLVDIGAEWCAPCRKMEPVLQQLQKDLAGKFNLLKVDAGIHTAILQQTKVSEFPTFIVYKDGKELWRKQGIVGLEELKKQINAN